MTPLIHPGVSRRTRAHAGSTVRTGPGNENGAPGQGPRILDPVRTTHDATVRSRTAVSVSPLPPAVSSHGAQDTLPYYRPAGSDAPLARQLDRALRAGIDARALRFLTCVLLRCPADEWLSTAQMADAADMHEHASRRPIGDLVAAGLLGRRRKVVDLADGRREPRFRYYVTPVTS